MTVTSRRFAGETDYQQMRELLIESHALAEPPVHCTVGYTIGDLDWWRWTVNEGESIADAHLWFDGDRLIAFAWPGVGQVDLIVHPAHREVEAHMLDWAATQSLATSIDGQNRTVLKTWAFDGDKHRTALLHARGFERTDEALCFRMRTLDGRFPVPALPGGYRIRNVEGEQDLERRVAVHRDAFSPSRMTVEKHRNVMNSATYRSDLDLVVEASDGSFAAYCLIWFDERNRFGLFEPVGCHSAHRREGLTKAVMYEGMHRLKDLGATNAYVNSKLGEPAPAALYESVGMPVLDETHAWAHVLE